MVCWGIWVHRNKGIFCRITTPQVVVSNILAIASHFTLVQKSPQVREIRQETIVKSFPGGYFDGSAQGDPIYCGAGVVLYLTEEHYYLLKWGLGVGTNNKAELLALYMLLIFAHEEGLLRIRIFMDSILGINWLNNTLRCHNIQLKPILEEVAQLKSIFNLITFRHIYREWNAEADRCSKEATILYQSSWDIEEHGPNGAYHFYYRPFIKAPYFVDA